MIKPVLPFLLFAAFLATPAAAGPAEQPARAHFKAIGAGDVDALITHYAPNATLQWVGGPLDGAYAGVSAIREVWTRFARNAPLKVTVGRLEESANDKGATVTADVQFQGGSTIKVRYVLVYREGRLVDEVWQIDPGLPVTAY